MVTGKAKQKRDIAARLIRAAANELERIEEELHDGTSDDGIDPEFARECFARWLGGLPGDYWDVRLNATGGNE